MDYQLEPEPAGERVPPGRIPPTAVGVAMLPPEEPVRPRRERGGLVGMIRRALERVFDASDELAGRIRRELGRR